jgi:23S rRNA (adenine1618-N6)-methyltransferase
VRPSAEKSDLHPRNRHRARYDFAALIRTEPGLARFVRPNEYGDESIDFADPLAVKTLNQALLRHYYGVVRWDIPDGYLCPPIPGRADYIHHVSDLLAGSPGGAAPRGPGVAVLDIGTGANCVYPIIGAHEYGWRFVGSEVDAIALANARRLVAANPALAPLVECRHQPTAAAVFRGVIQPGERFDLTICNPPFHASRAEAAAGTQRKLRNLAGGKKVTPVLNFGGQTNELICPGGELAFVRKLIAESVDFAQSCRWFTTLVSKSANLPILRQALARVHPAEVRVIPMHQGQKQSRILAWRF